MDRYPDERYQVIDVRVIYIRVMDGGRVVDVRVIYVRVKDTR